VTTEAARFFLALSDPTRLALLEELRGGECTVGELVERLGCPQPKVSRHLKALKDAGLARDRREGRNVHYALAPRRAWPPAAREWIDRLDAGLLPEEMVPSRRERPAPPARPERPEPQTSRRPVVQAPVSPELEDWLL
jgi:DNA-binding transcriptional ArsR family regulator